MSEPTAFPLDESKLPFKIPKDTKPREKIMKLFHPSVISMFMESVGEPMARKRKRIPTIRISLHTMLTGDTLHRNA